MLCRNGTMQKAKQNGGYSARILVIDDQRSQLKVTKSWLSTFGFQVVTVDSAEEAEQIMKWGEAFSLIITDLKMPWLNGVEFCRRVKIHHPESIVVALSGNINSFDQDELESSGFKGIYQKPITKKLIKKILIQTGMMQVI